jgi:predicted short-subunit dehydrogenase-like oxidoreductase (DUF2520 family)
VLRGRGSSGTALDSSASVSIAGVAFEKQRIGIVGLGRLGSCLARALTGARLGPVVVMSARAASAQALWRELGDTIQPVASLAALREQTDWVFLAVPDGRVAELCDQLALAEGQAVVHVSGALDGAVLGSARARGAHVGVFHPLQAFVVGAPRSRFRGIQIGVEGDAELEARLSRLARRLGATPFSLRGVDRAAYHAAAVFASNYVVALHSAAALAWQRAGLPQAAARAALLPLTRGAVDAIAEHELVAALTGPLQRGDVASVERHLAALAGDAQTEQLYRALARELLRLPLALDAATRERLQRLLER